MNNKTDRNFGTFFEVLNESRKDTAFSKYINTKYVFRKMERHFFELIYHYYFKNSMLYNIISMLTYWYYYISKYVYIYYLRVIGDIMVIKNNNNNNNMLHVAYSSNILYTS